MHTLIVQKRRNSSHLFMADSRTPLLYRRVSRPTLWTKRFTAFFLTVCAGLFVFALITYATNHRWDVSQVLEEADQFNITSLALGGVGTDGSVVVEVGGDHALNYSAIDVGPVVRRAMAFVGGQMGLVTMEFGEVDLQVKDGGKYVPVGAVVVPPLCVKVGDQEVTRLEFAAEVRGEGKGVAKVVKEVISNPAAARVKVSADVKVSKWGVPVGYFKVKGRLPLV